MGGKNAHPFADFVDAWEKLMAVMAPGRPKHCPDLSAAAMDYDRPLEQSGAMSQGSQSAHRTKLEIYAGRACPAHDSTKSAVVFAAQLTHSGPDTLPHASPYQLVLTLLKFEAKLIICACGRHICRYARSLQIGRVC